MDCTRFQDSITDYIDGTLDSRTKAECAAHRLTCRECRETYGDVRNALQALSFVAEIDLVEPEGLQSRIIAATSAGEMLSCADFDTLIERYFDGVILAPTFQTFQAHFEKCHKCRRLMTGIEDAIDMCHEIKETEIDVPEELNDRIVAATTGGWSIARYGVEGFLKKLSGLVFNPQIAVALLIFAAGSMFVISRFGSIGEMADIAGSRAEVLVSEGQKALSNTEAFARTGFHRVSSGVNTFFFSPPDEPAEKVPVQPASPALPALPALEDKQSGRLDPKKKESMSKTRADRAEREEHK
ncbi:MAG: zf-HC2 domain-containing protein [Acidobacteria bacterium]|nr:zf-HC2 domain-containing protein [Acidobacteriota bacterium]